MKMQKRSATNNYEQSPKFARRNDSSRFHLESTDVEMKSPTAASPFPKLAKSKTQNTIERKRSSSGVRDIEYLSRLKILNNNFASFCRREWEKMEQSIKTVDISERSDLFFIEEAKQYKVYAEELKRIYFREECFISTFGMGDCGQLGLSESKLEAKRPCHMKNSPSNVTVLACGGLHNAVVCSDGTVYTWGCNDEGALGINDDKNKVDTSFFPVQVHRLCQHLPDLKSFPPSDAIKWVGTGDSHTLALSYTGKVYMFGAYKDKEGRCWRDIPPAGWPEIKDSKDKAPQGIQGFPVPVSLIKDKVDMVACGSSFNVALLEDNTLLTWGMGECGELGRTAIPIRKKDSSYDLDIIRKHYLTPAPPRWACGGSYRVHSIACGSYHTLVITQGFRVATMGLNNYGQLGHGDLKMRYQLTFVEALNNHNVKVVDGGGHHSLCICGDGRMLAFGRGDSGQLGTTDGRPSVGYCEESPVQVLLPGDNGEDKEPKERVKQISCGTNHNLAVTDNDGVYTWGYGDMCALGHGRSEDEYRPVKLQTKSDLTVHQAIGGGQHSALLCAKTSETNTN